MDLESRLNTALFRKWQKLSLNSHKPIYFYVISEGNTGWGVVVPELLGVLKHARYHDYEVCFIANEGSHTQTVRFLSIGANLRIWSRSSLIELASVEPESRFLAAQAWNSDQLRSLSSNVNAISYVHGQLPAFHWPFGDVLRCMIHSTQFVHPDFTLQRSTYRDFEQLTTCGFLDRNTAVEMTPANRELAARLVGEKEGPRYILSLREAPGHHGIDRNTVPEALDKVLSELTRFTSEVDLVGTTPSLTLGSILRKYTNELKINDHTINGYEAIVGSGSFELHQRLLVQTYLLTTSNIKILGHNGIIVLPCAADRMYAIYSTPYIFISFIRNALVIPNAFEHAPKVSAVKALLHGLSTNLSTEWYKKRLSPANEIFNSAIVNLLQTYSATGEVLRESAVYNPRLLQETRRLLNHSRQLSDVDFGDFGSHLIQDRPGLPLRYA